MARFKSVAPAFLVAEVGTTARWYAEHLGFKCYPFPDREPYAFAILERDGVEIMLQHVEGYEKPDLSTHRPVGIWDAYIRMTGVKEWYEQLKGKPIIKSHLIERPYRHWEFEIRDLNGYTLVFSESMD
jgi:hypothetical protein